MSFSLIYIRSIFDFIVYFLDAIGYSGPVILFACSLYLLSEKGKETYAMIYILGFLFNIVLNFALKGLIQQPRPAEDTRLFNLEQIMGKRISYDRYGMPSGHAQTALYSTLFTYFVFKNMYITGGFLLVSLLTAYQRVKYQNHTWFQVLVGAVVGAWMAYLCYYYGKRLIQGFMRAKKDDHGPV